MNAWICGATVRSGFFLTLAGSVLLAGPAQGDTWQPLGPEGANVIAVTEGWQDPTRYWALVDNQNDPWGRRSGLRTSTDGGLTWEDVRFDQPLGPLKAMSLHDNGLNLLTDGLIYRKARDSNEVSIVQPPQQFSSVYPNLMVPVRADSAIMVAFEPDEFGLPGGLALTFDGGDSWSVVTPPGTEHLTATALAVAGPGPQPFRAAAYRGADDHRELWVFRSTIGWIRIDAGLPAGEITGLEWIDRFLMVTVDGAGVWISDIWSGPPSPWERLDPGFATRSAVNTVVNAWSFGQFFGTESGLHRTSLHLGEWDLLVDGTRGQRVRAISSAFVASQQRMTLGAYPAGILISTDKGQSFQAVSTGLYDRPTLSVAGNPTNPRELLTIVDDEGTTRLKRSRDLGETWHALTSAPRHARRVFYSPEGQVFVLARGTRATGGTTAFYQQPDGRWMEARLPGAAATGSAVSQLVFSQHRAGRVWAVGADSHAAGSRASVWRSDDAGSSWTQVWLAGDAHSALELMPVAGSADQDLLLVVRRSGFLTTLTRSTDGGVTWFDYNEGLEGNATSMATCAFTQEPGTVYAKIGNSLDMGSVYRRDLGEPTEAWSPVVMGPYFFQRFICDDARPGTFYASTHFEGLAAVRQASVHEHWGFLSQHQISQPSRIDDLVLTPAGLFMASERGVMHLAAPAEAPAPVVASLGSVDGRMQRIVQLHWEAGGAWVDVYRDGEVVASLRNTGHFSERLLRTGQAVEYQVCNAFSEGCSEPVMLAP